MLRNISAYFVPVVLAAGLLAGGCATGAGSKKEAPQAAAPPLVTVEYERLELESRKLTGAEFVFKFMIDNQSAEGRVFNQLESDLDFEGIKANCRKEGILIDAPAGSRAPFTVEFKVAYPAEPEALVNFLAKKIGTYTINGVLRGDGDPVEFGVTYEIGLPQAPQVSLPGASRASSGKGEVGFTFDIFITNPNVFGLKIDHLDYDLQIEGVPCGSGRVAEYQKLPANSQLILTFPAKIDLKTHGAQVREMLARRRLNWVLTGTLAADGASLPIKENGVINFTR